MKISLSEQKYHLNLHPKYSFKHILHHGQSIAIHVSLSHDVFHADKPARNNARVPFNDTRSRQLATKPDHQEGMYHFILHIDGFHLLRAIPVHAFRHLSKRI